MTLHLSFPERLDLIKRGPDDCWLWIWAKLPRGYGHFRRDKKDEYAHRAAYELHVGPIPKGAEIDHTCVNPPCCNPRHLVPRTPKDHHLRHTSERTRCRKGHEYATHGWHQFPSGQRYCQACYVDWYTKRNARDAAKKSLTKSRN